MSKSMSKKIIWALILLIAIFGFWQLSQRPSDSEEYIVIGAVLPLSGSAANFYGEYAQRGLELAKKEINNSGGINGKKLSIIYEDSQGQPRVGVQAINKLIAQNIKTVIGDPISGVTLSIAPFAEKNKVLVITPGSAAPGVTTAGDYIFRTKVSASVESKKAAEFIARFLNVRKIDFLYQNSDYGAGVFNAMKTNIEKEGLTVGQEELFEVGSFDMRTQLLKLRGSDSDLILMAGYPKEIGQVLKQASELGIKKKFFAHSGSVGPDIVEIADQSADELIFLYEISLDFSDSRTTNFFASYRARYSQEPELFSFLAYDTLYLLRDKIEKCGIDSDCIRDALYNDPPLDGISGELSFDHNGDITRNIFTLFVIKDGKSIKFEDL
jgi:branched-chain amino acid transport system substrate-binding protein